jgi:hypothetical protein
VSLMRTDEGGRVLSIACLEVDKPGGPSK